MHFLLLVGDYNSLGIPKVPPCRPKSPPCRPQPPNRPPLPTTPQKQAPKAGVISIVRPDPRSMSAGDSNVAAAAPNIPHRPAPPVASAQAYQDTAQKQTVSRQSSSSSSASSPVQESVQKQSPPAAQAQKQVESLVIHDQDTGAIYEEINDDIVSIVVLTFGMLIN